MARESKAILKLEDGKIKWVSSCCGETLAVAQGDINGMGLLIEQGKAKCKGILCKKEISFQEVGLRVFPLVEVELPK